MIVRDFILVKNFFWNRPSRKAQELRDLSEQVIWRVLQREVQPQQPELLPHLPLAPALQIPQFQISVE
jgi:hypothetical protein